MWTLRTSSLDFTDYNKEEMAASNFALFQWRTTLYGTQCKKGGSLAFHTVHAANYISETFCSA